jgi:hypothetical protein
MSVFSFRAKDFEEGWKKVGGLERAVLYFSSRNEDGSYWCKDCEKAARVLSDWVLPRAKARGLDLVSFDVGEREGYKNPDNQFRKHPKIGLKCIPTLAAWRKGRIVLRLEEAQLLEEGLVEELLQGLEERGRL